MELRTRTCTDRAPVPVKPPITSTERWKKWKSNKQLLDPHGYKLFLKNEALRSKRYRMSSSTEKKMAQRESAKLRMRKFREKMKEKFSSEEQVKKLPRRQTRLNTKTQETNRLYWRDKKREQRSRWSSQKKRRENEKAKLRYYNKTQPREPTSQQPNPTPPTSQPSQKFSTDSARRKAIQRAKTAMPKEAGKYASAIMGMISKVTPRKKEALKNMGIDSPKSRRRIQFCGRVVTSLCETLKKLKTKRDKNANYKKRAIVDGLKMVRKYKSMRVNHRELGLSWHYIRMLKSTSEDQDLLDNNRKKRADSLPEPLLQDVQEFYCQPGVSTELPGKKTVLKKTMTQRMVLDKPLTEVFEDYKKGNPGTKIGFSTFAKLKPIKTLTINKRKLSTCLCEYCTNIELKLRSLNALCCRKRPEIKIKGKYQASNMTLCALEPDDKFHKIACVKRDCEDCGTSLLKRTLEPLEEANEDISWLRWENTQVTFKGKTSTRKLLVNKNKSIHDFLNELYLELEPFSLHLFLAQWQYNQFVMLTKNVPLNWVVIVMDYSENFSCSFQDEIQSAHWNHQQVTLFPVVAYYKCKTCESGVNESIVIISSDLNHDAHASHYYVRKVNEHLVQTRGLTLTKEVQFSDGCASQFKSRVPFTDISFSNEDFGFSTERVFFGSRHGKGPSDGLGGVVKQGVTRAIAGRRAVIVNPLDMYNYCKLNMTKDNQEDLCEHSKRVFIYVGDEDVDRNRPHRNSMTVRGTMKLHSVRSVNDCTGVVYTRTLSCFCSQCISGCSEHCLNQSHVPLWDMVQLKLAMPTNRPVRPTDVADATVLPTDDVDIVPTDVADSTVRPIDDVADATVLPTDNVAILPTDDVATVHPIDDVATVHPIDDVADATVLSTDDVAIFPTDVADATVRPFDDVADATVLPTDDVAIFPTDVADATVRPIDVADATVLTTDVTIFPTDVATVRPTDNVADATVLTTDDVTIFPTDDVATVRPTDNVTDATVLPTDVTIFPTDVAVATVRPTDVAVATVHPTDALDNIMDWDLADIDNIFEGLDDLDQSIGSYNPDNTVQAFVDPLTIVDPPTIVDQSTVINPLTVMEPKEGQVPRVGQFVLVSLQAKRRAFEYVAEIQEVSQEEGIMLLMYLKRAGNRGGKQLYKWTAEKSWETLRSIVKYMPAPTFELSLSSQRNQFFSFM